MDLRDWQQPACATVDKEWIEECSVLPYFVSAFAANCANYEDYVQSIVEGEHNFFAKRELIDEFGWRNFGDTYADHEAVNNKGDDKLVSHYNNQYDFINVACIHFLRTGDPRWRELMVDAARHTIDIDIYHTELDRAAYNGGLFWHTDHYRDAATATHRTYSKANGTGSNCGGGPSNEHNYTSGLLNYYYMTGDVEERAAVVELAEWVIAMDDGDRSIFSFVNSSATGKASSTVSNDYHKPGRGAGNSINSLLDAYSLTEDRKFWAKAEDLIYRCIHPADNIGVLGLDEPEHRWSYLVYLQVLGKYLDTKVEMQELDYSFYYARDSLLHYASWIVDNEVPYTDVLDKVEIPTETWPAHDIRKCNVLHIAARYSEKSDRERFCGKAQFFSDRCLNDVLEF